MKTSISKMLSRVIALALVFCLSAQMMPLQIMANDYRNLEEMMEFLKPEGWDENKFNAYVYDVMLEIGFSDAIENLQY